MSDATRSDGEHDQPPEQNDRNRNGGKNDATDAGDNKDNTDRADKDGGGKDGNGGAKPRVKPLYKRPLVVGIGIILLIAIVAAGIMYWLYERNHQYTDDAFIDGYVTRVAPQVSGPVVHLLVADNQMVQAGDPLIEIDPRNFQAQLEQSRAQAATARSQVTQAEAQVLVQSANAAQADANVLVAEAELTDAQSDLKRYRSADARAVARQQIDSALAAARSDAAKLQANRKAADGARAQVAAAQAQVENARASVAQADAQVAISELQLSYTHVSAPAAGRIGSRTVNLGDYVTAGNPILSITQPDFWVTANFKETQLEYMKPGQPVDIVIDAYPDITFHGKVDSVQSATGQYLSILPAENATGNYVKVVQRVPVKIIFQDDRIRNYPLAPGTSVRPTVAIR